MRPSSGPRLVLLLLMTTMTLAEGVSAAEPQALAKARGLYNAADYDGAITAAAQARSQPGVADAAAVVEARARLERYRRVPDPADLAAARDALGTVHPSVLPARDQVDFLVGLGQSLYLGGLFGAAAELFDTAIERGTLMPARDRLMLLDWWATALDRDAQASVPERRTRRYEQMAARMEDELRRDAGSAPANYWLAIAARGAGDVDAAWDAAIAGWVRATMDPATSQALRVDIDRLVTSAIIPERARERPTREQADAADALRAQWASIKLQWK